MKKVIKGWVYKTWNPANKVWWPEDSGSIVVSHVNRRRGRQSDWYVGDWPPRRVTITIEVED